MGEAVWVRGVGVGVTSGGGSVGAGVWVIGWLWSMCGCRVCVECVWLVCGGYV